MNYRGHIEVHFHDQDRASAVLQSTGGADELYGHLMLFACFAVRHLINLGRGSEEGASLAQFLSSTSRESLANRHANASGDVVRLVDYPGHPGRWRFDAELRSEVNRSPKFTLSPKGFGLLRRGLGFYSPSSVMVFQQYLSERFVLKDDFQLALADASVLLGVGWLEGRIPVVGDVKVAELVATRATVGMHEIRSWHSSFDEPLSDAPNGRPDLVGDSLSRSYHSYEELAEQMLLIADSRRWFDGSIRRKATSAGLDGEQFLHAVQAAEGACFVAVVWGLHVEGDRMIVVRRAVERAFEDLGLRPVLHSIAARTFDVVTTNPSLRSKRNPIGEALLLTIERLAHCDRRQTIAILGSDYENLTILLTATVKRAQEQLT